MKNSHSNGHLTSFDVLITAHVICPIANLLIDRGSLGIDLKNFRMVQRKNYNTVV